MLYMIIKEMIYRPLNALFSLLAIITTVTLFIAFLTTGQASKRETVRLMRDMGFNVRIISGKTDMDKFWLNGYSDYVMPDEYISVLEKQKSISYNHLIAMLHKKVTWNGKDVILTGTSTEVIRSDRQKPMGYTIENGYLYIGNEIAKAFGIKKNDIIDLFGKKFTVKGILLESGSDEDIRIYGNLYEIQEILNLKGKINEIKAIECLCIIDPNKDRITALREQLNKVLPDTKMVLIRQIAEARQKQRAMIDKYFAFILPIILVVCSILLCVLGIINVNDRKQEIGIMSALGYSSIRIAVLFIGKYLLLGLMGAFLGFLIGNILAIKFGAEIFKVTSNAINPSYSMLWQALIITPAFAIISSLIPIIKAVIQEPADILKEG